MAEFALTPYGFDLSAHTFGRPQRSGAMTIIPLFGSGKNGKFNPPLAGLKISRVKGYGNVELENPSDGGVALVPLHIGYIQDKAQNHALCSAAFIGAGQKRMFHDACCVQQSQGGYLEGREQWFFILPLPLREHALKLRGKKSFSKLWDAIQQLNKKLGLPERGHLEQIVGGKRAYLNQYRSRFELLPGQTGALFLLQDKLAGVEVAPNAEYFEELWDPLVCFCYGPAAMYAEARSRSEQNRPAGFSAESLKDLRERLNESRLELKMEIQDTLNNVPKETFERQEEERYLSMRLTTVNGSTFAGQVVEDEDHLVYASIGAKSRYLFGSS